MTARDPLLDRPRWAPRWAPTIDDVGAMRVFRWVLTTVFVVGLGACVVEGANSPADPELGGDSTGSSPTTGSTPSLAARIGTVLVELLSAGGEVIELCLLDADRPQERAQGLMQVTDLEGHDGMLFRWDAPSENNFVMIDTVMPLSISWWDEGGGFVSGTDMEPCTEAVGAECPRYPAAAPYRWAIEVPQGTLPEASAGAHIEVSDEGSCDPTGSG